MLTLSNLILNFFNLRGVCVKATSFDPIFAFKSFKIHEWNFLLSSNNNLLISIHSDTIRNYKRLLKSIIKNFIKGNIISLLKEVNKNIDLWSANHYFFESWNNVSHELDLYTYKLLWKSFKKIHPRRSNSWIYSKYWKNFSGLWVFSLYNPLTKNVYFLRSHSLHKYYNTFSTLPLFLNIFDIFNDLKLNSIIFYRNLNSFSGIFKVLYKKQSGRCACCFKFLTFDNCKLISLASLRGTTRSISQFYLYHIFCG